MLIEGLDEDDDGSELDAQESREKSMRARSTPKRLDPAGEKTPKVLTRRRETMLLPPAATKVKRGAAHHTLVRSDPFILGL